MSRDDTEHGADPRRQEAADFLAALLTSSRTRDDTIDAILALKAMGHGTLALRVPRSPGRPIDGTVVLGGLTLKMIEEREIAS